MDTENNSSHSASELCDWAKSKTEFMLAWGLPLISVLALNFVQLPSRMFQGVVVVALAWMGVACLINAKRCYRVHCAFTGPWFLLGSGALLLDLLGSVSLDDNLATWIANITLLGGVALGYLTEVVWGKYWS